VRCQIWGFKHATWPVYIVASLGVRVTDLRRFIVDVIKGEHSKKVGTESVSDPEMMRL
jgi:hypothetical protein